MNIEKILNMKDLSPLERLALIALDLHPESGENNLTLAEELGMSLPTAASAVRKLHQLGYIEVTYLTDGHTSPQRKIEVKV